MSSERPQMLMIYTLTQIPHLTTAVAMKLYRRTSSAPSSQSDLTCKFEIWLVMIHKILIISIFSYQVPIQRVQLLPISLQVVSGARQTRRAPSLHQRETPVKANSAEASNESNLDTLDLKRNEISKEELVQEIRKVRRDKKHTYKTCQKPHIVTAPLQIVSNL